MSSLGLSTSALAETIAETVLEGFNKHFRIFQKITAGAMGRFETEDWIAERDAARKRVLFYDKRADEAIETLRAADKEKKHARRRRRTAAGSGRRLP